MKLQDKKILIIIFSITYTSTMAMVFLKLYSIALLFLTIGGAMFSVILLFNFLKKKRYLNSTIYKIDKMTGIEFEELLKCHFENLGYRAKETAKTNDYGADLIIKKDNEKILVQAKRYKNKVGIKSVQEIVGALGYYKAEKGIVITNSYFTKNAINLAKANNIKLWDRDMLTKVFSIKEDNTQK